MINFEPKYITFDMHGTLIRWQIKDMTRKLLADVVPADQMDEVIKSFAAQRLDEVLGPWKPFSDVIHDSLRKTLERFKFPYREADGQAIVDAVPTWGPYPEVPEALRTLASRYPLVILSNAAENQVMSNVEKLGAPFHAVFTAEQAQAYKPRFQAFEYMFNRLGCGPQDVLHVSASPRYDLMAANDLGVTNKVHVNRGFEPSTPGYGYYEVNLLSQVPPLLGI
jgi:2-haloacid dehalogenase